MPKAESGGKERILVLNPGSTSTKVAVFEGEDCVYENAVEHTELDLGRFERVWDQYEYRKDAILEFLSDHGVSLGTLTAVVGRGGLFKPTVSGTYRVNDEMIADARAEVRGPHVANLGAVLAFGIAWDYGIESFIVDPPCVDEMDAVARYSGTPDIERTSLVHALNVKAAARAGAKELGKDVCDANLVVAHLGGGITVASLRNGRMVDVTNGLSEGPFTPDRAGELPTVDLVKMCFSGEHDEEDIMKKLVGGGGLTAYLGTNNAVEALERSEKGDAKAGAVLEAMIYQIAKQIGAMAVVLGDDLDAIVLTGGIAKSEKIVARISERVRFLAGVIVLPGEDELRALAEGCLRVLRGEEEAKTYPETVDGGGCRL
ncbi:MAG: butyrate kinase [Candidatus Eisenbacteria bacterium]|nr:butyrate kinase [Candidatus Eisenbacteria bacterium]